MVAVLSADKLRQIVQAVETALSLAVRAATELLDSHKLTAADLTAVFGDGRHTASS